MMNKTSGWVISKVFASRFHHVVSPDARQQLQITENNEDEREMVFLKCPHNRALFYRKHKDVLFPNVLAGN